MPFQHEFKVANPSIYARDDYVEVDMGTLGVPTSLNKKSLKLFRITGHQRLEEIPFQIDQVLGENSPKQMLTFISTATPPVGADDYTVESATFKLEEVTPKDFSSARTSDYLWIAHYYKQCPDKELRSQGSRPESPAFLVLQR